MLVLGIGGSSHDFSYCLVEDGVIKLCIDEERISREKHALGKKSYCFGGLEHLLKVSNLSMSDIDLIVTNNLTNISALMEKPYIHNIVRINHHLAHAAYAYYTSPFDNCAIGVFDGCGDIYESKRKSYGEVISTGYAQGNRIFLNETINGRAMKFNTDELIPGIINSLGIFYMYISYICGFKYFQEGKTMGLAPYGTDKYVSLFREIMNYQTKTFFNQAIVDKIHEIVKGVPQEQEWQNKADLAYAAQYILEEFLFRQLNELYDKNKNSDICLSGGIMLNSALNGKLKMTTPYENIYIPPAAGDCGTSIGAALYGYYNFCGKKDRVDNGLAVYLGDEFSDDQILAVLKCTADINFSHLEFGDLAKVIAKNIAEGQICGWFQGRAEVGPRALGNRSILADPRNPKIKDYINSKVKYREDFRPFAPTVLQEFVHDYFETSFDYNPYMLYIGKVKPNKVHCLPAVTHVDGTSRMQTINRNDNLRYYTLIKEFYELTKIPVILNTSFNTKGEPIVNSPFDAIHTFMNCSLDCLCIGNYLVTKNKI